MAYCEIHIAGFSGSSAIESLCGPREAYEAWRVATLVRFGTLPVPGQRCPRRSCWQRSA